MAKEIERKFLVKDNRWKKDATGVSFRQGYLSSKIDCVVRVRMEGEEACLTIKGKNKGLTRLEFEYSIPISEANEMLNNLCNSPLIDKTRYHVKYEGLLWEIDEFKGDNRGLIVAEVELNSEDQEVVKPDWIGEEVSMDPKYYNINLVKNPYCNWD